MFMAHKVADKRPVSPRRHGAFLVGNAGSFDNGAVAAHVVHKANETVVMNFDIVARKRIG
jgi:hypothetical protein